jgi:hypothetical protein
MKKRIKILGTNYKLLRVSEDSKKLTINGEYCYAVIDHIHNRIYANKKISNSRLRKTLLHEIIHAIDVELVLGLPHKSIYRLAAGLASAGVKLK